MTAPDLLNLSGYRLLHVEVDEQGYRLAAGLVAPARTCPYCHSDALEVCGRRAWTVSDFPLHGRRVLLCLHARRLRCLNCARDFYEALPEIDEKRRLTRRFAAWIGEQAVRRSFASLAAEAGCSEFTVRSVFSDHVHELEKRVRFETPKWLGIDEIHLVKPRGLIANLQNDTVVELLPNRSRETVARYLRQLEGRQRIQYVAMDLSPSCRQACEEVIPDARIVIDRSHVVNLANAVVEQVRRTLRQRLTPAQKRALAHDRSVLQKRERDLDERERQLLSGWIGRHGELGQAYRLKEDFFAIYDAQSADEARGRYERWRRQIPSELMPAFAGLLQAWDDWRSAILAYFDHPVSNAYPESLGSLVRVMERLGRGYSFAALRARILFADGAHQHRNSRPRFERREKERRQAFRQMLESCLMDEPRPTAAGGQLPAAARSLSRPAARPPLLKPVHPATWRGTAPPAAGGPAEKNYGAGISSLVRIIESEEL